MGSILQQACEPYELDLVQLAPQASENRSYSAHTAVPLQPMPALLTALMTEAIDNYFPF